jgi:membrane associated rhomboid family serine protease
MEIISDIKQTFREGSALTKLIYINLGVFILLMLTGVFFYLSAIPNPLAGWLSVPSDLHILLRQPWSVVTYMFTHTGFLHILFNLLGLYWFGKLFLYRLDSGKLLSVYLLGGIFGAIFYIAAYNLFPVFENVDGLLLGASASVYAVLVAVAVYDPNMELHLSFIGTFKLKYVSAFYVLLSVISISVSNPGGNIAHLGGAAWGWLYILQLRKGKDMGWGTEKLVTGFGRFLANLFKPKSKLKVTHKQTPRDDYEYNRMKNAEQQEINRILEKIAKSGYDSLTKSEKELLFRQGKS